MAITDRFKQAWKAFTNKDPTKYEMQYMGTSYSLKPDRPISTKGVDKTIVAAFYARVAVDCANNRLQHVRLDAEGNFIEEMGSSLNYCFTQMANIDQTGREFLRDAVISLLDEGCIAILPITTDRSIYYNDTFNVDELRVGKIVTWYPKAVRVRLYNQEDGQFREITVPKASVAIVENPFYSIMNEPNSVLQRLIRKLALIDSIDEKNASGKLDLIIQLPYVIKTESRQKQAEERRGLIESQLTGSKYGIAYIDGSEHITQLNRPVENNLMTQVEYYTKMFYNQMGISEEIMNGTAKDDEKNEYFNHIIEPILTAIAEAMTVKFLSLKARTQHQAIRYYRQPFRAVSYSTMAELIKTLSMNEICTGNEIRQFLGLKPSDQPSADELRNKNNAPPTENPEDIPTEGEEGAEEPYNPMEDLYDFQKEITDLKTIDSDIGDLEQLIQSDFGGKHFLVHTAYSSKYYDPVKAHEYYEEHKTLKGYENRYGGSRASTKGLNEKGREVAKIVKEKITANRKSANETLREQANSEKDRNRAEHKQKVTDMSSTLKDNIADLKAQLHNMNDAQKKHAKIKIRAEVERLREEANKLRQELSDYYSKLNLEISANTKEGIEKNAIDADNEYASEIAKMLKDPSLVQSSKKKKSSGKDGAWKLAIVRKPEGVKRTLD
ncbi:MAG: phage portal protein [Bacilli bacterium]|nr:phage portal protein [Bacilli bacterium]